MLLLPGYIYYNTQWVSLIHPRTGIELYLNHNHTVQALLQSNKLWLCSR